MRQTTSELQNLSTAAQRGGGVLVVLLLATTAAAQVAQVQQGHILDANPGVNGGGSNAPVNGYVPVNGNDIMTGNVTGLGYFHGTIPYRSPYELHGTIGSGGSLSAFARQSSGGTALGQMRTFYTPSSLVSAQGGMINPGLAASKSASGVSISIMGPNSVNPTSSLGANALANTKVELAPPSQTFDYGKLGSQPLVPTTDSQNIDPLYGLQRTMEVEPVPAVPVPHEEGTPGVLLESKNKEKESKMIEPKRQIMPRDIGFGEQVSDQRIDQAVDAIQTVPKTGHTLNAVPPPQLDGGIKVSESFQSVLDGLRQNNGPGLRFDPAGLTAEGAIPDSTRFAMPGSTPKSEPNAKALGPGGIDPLTGQPWQPGHAGAKDTQSVDPTKGNYKPRDFTAKVPGEDLAGGPGAGKPADRGGAAAGATTKPAAALLRTPPTTTAMLLRADEQVQAGQYLRAAETYQSTLRLDPSNRAALVGRSNAELAAGMYETAAYDLKYLYTQDPAQMTMHYHLQNILPAKRLEYLEKDLLALAAKKEPTPAAFLLAYLYYQMDRPADLRTHLAAWSKQVPADAWPGILKQAWIEEPKPAATAPAQP